MGKLKDIAQLLRQYDDITRQLSELKWLAIKLDVSGTSPEAVDRMWDSIDAAQEKADFIARRIGDIDG